MTEQMAVEYLNRIYHQFTPVDEYGYVEDFEPYEKAVDIAIKALDKQIPKKCNINNRAVLREGSYKTLEIKVYRCPICNHEPGTDGVVANYCVNCGQKLKGSDEDDI